MPPNNFDITGLNDQQVISSREKYGANRLDHKKESGLFDALLALIKEPMIVLLVVASGIYFVSGSNGEGIFLSCAIVFLSLKQP